MEWSIALQCLREEHRLSTAAGVHRSAPAGSAGRECEEIAVTAGAQLKPIYSSIPEITIRSAVPVVRLAKLRRYDPVLTLKQAEEAWRRIKQAWLSGLAAKYLANAAIVFGIP